VTLACEKYVINLEGIQTLINAKIPVVFPEDEMFMRDKSRGLIFKPRAGAPESRHPRPGQQRSGRPRTGRPKNPFRSENRRSF
jgi:hypothetical protein